VERAEIAQPSAGPAEALVRVILQSRETESFPTALFEEASGSSREGESESHAGASKAQRQPVGDDHRVPAFAHQLAKNVFVTRSHDAMIANVKRKPIGFRKFHFTCETLSFQRSEDVRKRKSEPQGRGNEWT
jgi:hypothetical protein